MNRRELSRAAREGAARAGTSLLEVGSRTGHHPENIAQGTYNTWSVRDDVGLTEAEFEELGHD